MTGKWLLRTPPIPQPYEGYTFRQWRFETKTAMMEYCKLKGLNVFKKDGCRYTYIIGNPTKEMMKFR